MNLPTDLYPGDILLYASPDFVDDVIEWKTGDDVAHVEVYVGNSLSWASRNGIGVNEYPYRSNGLMYVRRPTMSFDLTKAKVWFEDGVKGLPYGFGDILAVMDIKNNLKGIDCSHFASSLLEVAGCPQFTIEYPRNKITPRDFKIVLQSFQIYLPLS
jgi:hypothetical protein